MSFRGPIRRTRSGRYQLRLARAERELLRSLPRQVRPLVEAGDPDARRLFPPAYPSDEEREKEFQDLMHEELTQRHLRSLAVLEETADRTDLDGEEALGWLGALNDLRLVLGTQLDVTEETIPAALDDDGAQAAVVYTFLSWLEAQLVEALAEPS